MLVVFCMLYISDVCDLVFRYSSGGEDGYVRVHQFDQQYFDFEFEY